jgi:hypothetical protein
MFYVSAGHGGAGIPCGQKNPEILCRSGFIRRCIPWDSRGYGGGFDAGQIRG